ncbi:Ig-like domain-containing protein [Pediococcus acidilactici]|uniref:Ig-like domain-containing protein n=1 Tax=Pediococcus acidilactici TaxID=1254 RepID=UPI001F3C39C0|nr:Ig-like domain-containing protein [Pediococcus acidilactici]
MKRGNGSNLQVNAELLKDCKVRQRWLLASAVALSMLGAGAMVNVGNASADTVGNNTPTTQIAQSSKMTASSKKADVKTDVAAPGVNRPYAGDRTVTGTGTPRNTIVVYDDLKNEIGRAIVGEDGEYSVEIKAEYELFAGETISVVQIDADGKESSPVNMVIQDRVPTPVIDQPYEGDRTVVGIGTPGYTVIIYDDLENEIGRATVDQYGIFRDDIHIGYNLYAGETITAIQRDAMVKKANR